MKRKNKIIPPEGLKKGIPESEERQRDSEAKIRSFFAAMEEVVLVLDADGRYVEIAPSALHLLYKPPDEMLGKTLSEILPPDCAEPFLQCIRDVLDRGVSRSIEYAVEIGEKTVWFLARVTPYSPGCVLWVARDITQRKQAKADFEKKATQEKSGAHILALIESERELVSLHEKAMAAVRAKNAFLANMSHEIRTPMNAVIGLSQRLMDMDMGSGQRVILEKIIRSSRTMASLVNDVLDYSKMDDGHLRLNPRRFDIRDLRDQMDVLFTETAEKKKVELIFRIAPDVPCFLIGDELRLGQVLANLLGNALKFTERGRVELTITFSGILSAGSETQKTVARLRFEVRDTGIGFDVCNTPDLFKPFFQADDSTTRRYGGTGLGLAISHRLVELMGGALWVESTPGQGSFFMFELPLPVAPDSGAGSEESAEGALAGETDADSLDKTPSFAGASILLVEDNALNREVAEWLLRKTGARVMCAHNGAEALDLFQTRVFDLVLMDIQMPDMDGYEATRRIRGFRPDKGAPPSDPGLPIIALTAAVLEDDQKRFREADMNAFVGKPVEPRILYETLARFLEPRGVVSASGPAPAVSVPGLPSAMEGFDVNRALRFVDNDAGMFHRLWIRFAGQLDDFSDLARRGREDADEEVRRQVHTLKGLSGTVGAVRLAQITKVIDQALKRMKPVEPSRWDALANAVDAARETLAGLPPFPDEREVPRSEPGIAAVDRAWKALQNQEWLRDDTFVAAARYFEEYLGPGVAEVFRARIRAFDLDGALDALRKLKRTAERNKH